MKQCLSYGVGGVVSAIEIKTYGNECRGEQNGKRVSLKLRIVKKHLEFSSEKQCVEERKVYSGKKHEYRFHIFYCRRMEKRNAFRMC